VHVRLNSKLTDIKAGVVLIGSEKLLAGNIVRAAGVCGSEIFKNKSSCLTAPSPFSALWNFFK